jgi:uncharacterized protein (TIGR02757 family)
MDVKASPAVSRDVLEWLYRTYNQREMVHPDPLEFLYCYEGVRDREVVGLLASCLSYGRVAQILNSVRRVLERMPAPSAFVERSSPDAIGRSLAGFKHRFTTGRALAGILVGAGRLIRSYGSLGAAFGAGLRDEHETVLPALAAFVRELSGGMADRPVAALPSPEGGSACKRLNLFLRWMVRRDAVDPGGWDHVPASKLVVPLDTHMLRIGRALGLTTRHGADVRTALEVTAAFRRLAPDDPVRYDFALTRLGIRRDRDLNLFLKQCRKSGRAVMTVPGWRTFAKGTTQTDGECHGAG